MSIRLPSAESYAEKVQIEQRWLPRLAPHLSCKIPKPLAMGQPSTDYPWNWSVYQWIDGESANTLTIDEAHLPHIASQLAQFLIELQTINATEGPIPGPHNFYRGGSLSVYDAETQSALAQLHDFIDIKTATDIWQKALFSQWNNNPVWVHGDFSAGNILINDNRLTAVIDFGGMGVGDPACDLVIAWTFLKNESQEIFRSSLHFDADTWARARGWALWKALITLVQIEDKMSNMAAQQLHIIDGLIYEHMLEN